MKFNKKITISIATILFLGFGITTISNADTAIVNTETLNLRKEDSTNSSVLKLLNLGEKLNIIDEVENWYKVKTKDGVIGYVSKDYIKVEETEENEPIETIEENNKDEKNNKNNEEKANITSELSTNNENNVDNQVKEFEMKEETIKINSDVYILPLLNSSKLQNIEKNSSVILIDETNNWYYVQTDEVNGWVPKNVINPKINMNSEIEESTNIESDESEIQEKNTEETTNNENVEQEVNNDEKELEKKTMYVNYSSIYVRKGPGTNYDYIDTLVLNNSVQVIGEIDDWYKVEVDGKTGYISKRLLSNSKQDVTDRNADERADKQDDNTNKNSSIGQQIVDYAKQYLGCKYVYGGSGPSTFDCSGFTMYVYKNFGISLSHSATAQSKKGVYVSKEDLQPGDLVFFKDYETMQGIGHCGIYIGDGNFIHASSGTGYCVKISTLLSGSYNTRYETARRIF